MWWWWMQMWLRQRCSPCLRLWNSTQVVRIWQENILLQTSEGDGQGVEGMNRWVASGPSLAIMCDNDRFHEWSSYDVQSVHQMLESRWGVKSYSGVVLGTLYELFILNKLAWTRVLKWKPVSLKEATKEPSYTSQQWFLKAVFHGSRQAGDCVLALTHFLVAICSHSHMDGHLTTSFIVELSKSCTPWNGNY